MIIGHLGISYLLSQTPGLIGNPISPLEQAVIVVSGYIFDWDVVLPGQKGGSNHHFSLTHTPFFGLLLYGVIYLTIHSFFQPITMIFIAVSLLFHLVADDFSYWLYQWGITKEFTEPQIVWLYPLQKRSPKLVAEKTKLRTPVIKALRNYVSYYTFFVKAEIIIVFLALIVFTFQAVNWQKTDFDKLTHKEQKGTIQSASF